MIERILGIDLGIASLGWAVIEFDDKNVDNNKIIDCGVRLFTAAETPKEKESPGKARSNAKGIRRIINRKRVRMNKIKKLCESSGLLSHDDLDPEHGIFNSKGNRTDVWQLRYDALHRKLDEVEFARVLIHIAKHRGHDFQTKEGDVGKVRTAGEALKSKLCEAGCRSIGEYIWLYPHIKDGRTFRRNKKDDYTISIHRSLLKAEVDEIFNTQEALGNTKATQQLKEQYTAIAFYVRPIQSIEKMVGFCTYFPQEKRAPKASPTAERFIAIGKFYTTVITDNQGNEHKIIELKSYHELMEFASSKEQISYKQLRKFLALNDQQIFKNLTYKSKPKKGEAVGVGQWEFDKNDAEKKSWISLKGHSAFKSVMSNEQYTSFMQSDLADETAKVLTYFKDKQQKRDNLLKLGHDIESADLLCDLSFTDFVQLSIKALKIIVPEMQMGKRYDEAILLLGKPAYEKSIYLPPLKDTDINILNPTVIRAFAQFRKVANALVRKYGSFDKVHFELAREVNTKADIDRIKQAQRKNEKEREAAKVWIQENFEGNITVNYKNILKKRLFEQQSEICPYTDEHIQLERLYDEGYYEIDHILPRSRSGDDSMANKVLVFGKANQDKTNRTPYEWFGHDTQAWERYETRINTITNRAKMGMGKINRLLKKNFDENSEKEFRNRNLNDTRYMARAIKNYCENYWQLTHDDNKRRVQVRSGKLTSELRGRWVEGYMKDRTIHTHHALDAIVIAFSTESMVQRLSNYYKTKEIQRKKEKPVFEAPMKHFRQAVDKALMLEKSENITTKDGRTITLNRLLISRPPRASITGAAHKETIQSPKKYTGRGVSINQGKGMCDNGDMPRVDVFTKDGKYYLVPIYVADFSNKILPNKAIVAGKGKEWIEMDESYNFLFSLAKEDLVEIQLKKQDPLLGYFKGVDSSTAQVKIQETDSEILHKLGSKTAVSFRKFTIDPLGYYHEIKLEKRLDTNQR